MCTKRLSLFFAICFSLFSASLLSQKQAQISRSRYYSHYLEEEKAMVHVVKTHRLSVTDAIFYKINKAPHLIER